MAGLVSRVIDRDWRGLIHRLTRTHPRALATLAVLAFCFFMPGQFSLQPMDRDEPRFAQATKQMLETRDFVDIRFQEEARHKKPVGIYWLQAAAVSTGEALGIPDARRVIGLYRIPSLIGAIVMVLLTYWAALAFLSRQGAFLAALMMAASVLLGVEARLGKTDAVLGALSIAVFGFLARLYLNMRAPEVTPRLNTIHLVLGWIAMGLAILIKGPITPLLVAVTLLVLFLRDRQTLSPSATRPGLGFLIMAGIVLPWLTLILMKSGVSFFEESVGKDMIAKVGSAQEKHGAPPGTYFGVFWMTFWPAAPLALLAAPFVWRERNDDGVAFLIGWIVPWWLILEIVPTKLPHYVLPLYPAIAILIMLAVERRALAMGAVLRGLAAALLVLVPLIFLIGAPAIFLIVEEGIPLVRLPYLAMPFLILAFALALAGAIWLAKQRPMRAFSLAAMASLGLTLAAYPFGLPMLKAFNLSPRLAEAARATGCVNPAFATLGYREPSLVFLTNTKLLMGTPVETAAFFDAESTGCRIAFVEKGQEAEFRASLKGLSAPVLLNRVRGVNLNAAFDKQRRLRVLDMAVYVRR